MPLASRSGGVSSWTSWKAVAPRSLLVSKPGHSMTTSNEPEHNFTWMAQNSQFLFGCGVMTVMYLMSLVTKHALSIVFTSSLHSQTLAPTQTLWKYFFSDASQPVSQWPRVVKAAQNTPSCNTWRAIFYMVMYFAKSWIVLVIVVHPIISRTLLFQTLFNCTKIPRYFPHFCHHLGWFPKNNGRFSDLKKSPFVIICRWNFFNICLTLRSIWLL